MKYIVFLFVWLNAFFVSARTVNVADYGIVPGADATFKLNRLLEEVRNEEGVTLYFPKGVYDFYPEYAFEEWRAVSNHDNSLKRIAFPLYGHKGVTIDGGGAKFVFHGFIVPFTVEGADGVTLKNFTIDWIQSFHAEMETVSRDLDRNSAVFKVDPKLYPHSVERGELSFKRYEQIAPIGSNIVFDPATRAPIFNTRDYSLNGRRTTAKKPAKDLVELVGGFRKEPPPVGSILVVYGVHPFSRLAPAIHVSNSKNLRVEGVTIHEAAGMGLIVERTENVYVDGMTVSSSSARHVATRADATHFIGCKGELVVENSLFEHMLDDSINVHGAYVNIDEYIGGNTFLCSISHFQQWGLIFGEAGDEIALLSRETVLPFFNTKITDVRKLNEKTMTITVAEVPEELPTGPLSMENLTWYPDFVFRNNTVRENRARSILVTTKGKVVIEDNYLSSQMHGILIEGDNKKWYESGGVQDVVIRNNEFVNSGFGNSGYYPLIASPMLTPEQRLGEGHYHRNIRFENNKVRSFNGHLVFARSVQGLEVLGNQIELSGDYPVVNDGPSIYLEYCDDVLIEGNRARVFENGLEITSTEDCENVRGSNNAGYVASEQGMDR